MIKKFVLFSFLYSCMITTIQAQNIFNRIYDDSFMYDGAMGIVQTSDDGYAITGNTLNLNTGYSALLVAKLNNMGDTIWIKEFDFGSLGSDKGSDIIQLVDSSFIVTGATYDSIQQRRDAFLLHLDANGNLLWFKKYGDIYNDVGYMVKQTLEGGFVMAGWSQQVNGYEDGYLVKTDSAGNIQWQHHYGGGNADLVYSVDFTSDGGYILGGRSYSYSMGVDDLYMVKTDSLGNEQWHHNYGTTGDDYGQTVISTLDNGYLLVGGIEVPVNSGLTKGYIIKTNNLGIVQWNKILGIAGYNEVFVACRQQSDSNYIVIGGSGFNNYEGWLVKLNTNGDTLFTKKYRYYPDTSTYHPQHYFYNMDLTSDGGVVMTGMVINNPLPQKNDFWVVKVDSMGCADTSCAVTTNLPELISNQQEDTKIYPNPAANYFTVALTGNNKKADVNISDITGNIIYTTTVTQKTTINTTAFAAGVYLLQIKSTDFVETKKIMVAK